MSHRTTRAGAAVLLVALISPSIPAVDQTVITVDHEDAIRRSIKRELELQGRKVKIDGAVSELTVTRSPDDLVHIDLEMSFWSNVESYREQVERELELRLLESSEVIEIGIDLPRFDDRQRRGTTIHYEIELDVAVPESTALAITNKYGNVRVDDVRGPAEVSNQSGNIAISAARGDVRLESRFGSIDVGDIAGNLWVHGSSGSLKVRGVTGNAALVNQYAEIVATDIGGDLEAQASSGAIKAAHVGGDALLVGSYEGVEIEDVQGSVKAEVNSGGIVARNIKKDAHLSSSYAMVDAERIGGNAVIVSTAGGARVGDVGGTLELRGAYGEAEVRHTGGPTTIDVTSGSVTADRIGGRLDVSCSYGTVRASRIQGDLRVRATNAQVWAEEIHGGADIETSYEGVGIDGVAGPVTVLDKSGAVTVGGLTGDALTAAHRVRTSYADIRFDWPEGRAVTYRLESTYGSVHADIPGQATSSGSRRTLEGGNGEGSARIELIAESGSVVLKTQ